MGAAGVSLSLSLQLLDLPLHVHGLHVDASRHGRSVLT